MARSRRRSFYTTPMQQPASELPQKCLTFCPRWSARLRALREAAGLSQTGWATWLGVSRATVQRWETGRLAPGADVEAALLDACARKGLFRSFQEGPWRGLTLSPEVIRGLLADARAAAISAQPRSAPRRMPDADLPAGAAEAVGAGPPRLPVPLTRFVGREQALGGIPHLLGSSRLVTLVGPGGVGKTRLALQVADALAEQQPGSVRLVELAALSDGALVTQQAAASLGIREQPDGDLVTGLIRALERAELVLVVDNCEHLVGACAELVHTLLRACAGVRVLATSRTPLGVPGEALWRVLPLGLPEPAAAATAEALLRAEAVRLFVDRARLVQPTFALGADNAPAVAAVCARLEGLPLAIELAAAHVGVLTPAEVAARLADRFGLLVSTSPVAAARHRSLQAALDWSYELLSDGERTLLQRLTVFAGGWTLDAAEGVGAGEPVQERAVLGLLKRLVDHSLVVAEPDGAGQTRYLLLETVREYALQHRADHDTVATLHRRHRDWYLALAEAAAAEMVGQHQSAWLRRLDAEHDNLRAALRWTIDQADTEPGLRLGAALWRFWFNRGYFAEGRRWLEQLLALPDADAPGRALSMALFGAGTLALEQTDFAAARAFADRALDVSQACGYARVRAAAWLLRGNIARARGEYAAARRRYQQALRLQRARTDTEQVNEDIAIALGTLGHVALAEGDYARARASYQEALAIERAHGQHKDIANLLYRLGEVALEEGCSGESRVHFEESLALAQEIGDRQRLAYLLEGFAALAAAEQDTARARVLAAAAARLRVEIGSPLPPPEQRRLERRLAGVPGGGGEQPELTLAEAVALAVSPAD